MSFKLIHRTLHVICIKIPDFQIYNFDYFYGKKVLKYFDRLAVLFGCTKITLTDEAIDIDNKQPKGILISLISLMKDGKLFYEKYGYAAPKIELETLRLRFIPFPLFLQTLSDKHKRKILKTTKNATDFKYLHEYFTQIYKECKTHDVPDRLIYVQNKILFCSNYPWFSMMSIIFNQNHSMEKILNTQVLDYVYEHNHNCFNK